jgi:Tfp pilus assembly protein PilW
MVGWVIVIVLLVAVGSAYYATRRNRLNRSR